MNQGVLVLNQNYEPLNICRLRRALVLMQKDKAQVIENDTRKVHTVDRVFESPSVIRIVYFVKKPRPNLQPSRQSIFARDGYTCQYCGKVSRDLTLDHVVPKRIGGKKDWENLVSACKGCNNRKGDKTLKEAKMKLIKEPKKPKYLPKLTLSRYSRLEEKEEWRRYLSYGSPA
ncbi:MAG: HNH endonuclease [Armatimonadetes bacterium CG07_land_8_20_14_0_80_40_9]|nr:MAG: HNH endonuclease [Armatimonadetes bacterium CG07_land_8_20_14_0_80_40_9]